MVLGSDTPFNHFTEDVIKEMGLSLKVSKLNRPVRPRRITSLTGVGPDESVGCFNNSLHNAVQTICCRVLCAEVDGVWRRIEDIRAPTGAVSLYLTDLTQELISLLPSTTPVPLDEFPLRYKGRKFKVYSRAVESLRIRTIDESDSTIKLFLKFEKDIRSLKPARIARAISTPDPRFIVETGRYVVAIEHKIYEAIDKLYGRRVVSKGMNFSQVGQLFKDNWDEFSDPISVDYDAEKMDRSTSREVLAWTHLITAAAFNGDDFEHITRMLSWQLDCFAKGRTDDGKFSYTVEGTLNSGQSNTSLVGVIMISMIMLAYIRTKGYKVGFVDAGDDCTVILERVNCKDFRDGILPFFKMFGFTMTSGETNDVLEGIEFCQAHPVKINGKYRMVRNARTAAVKDTTCPKNLRTPGEFSTWAQAVSDTGIATHGGVPVAQEIYAMMSRSAREAFSTFTPTKRQMKRHRSSIKRYSVEGGLAYWGKNMTEKYDSAISTETRISYYLAFGITPVDQRLLEAKYRQTLVRYNIPRESIVNKTMHLWNE